MLKRLSRIGLAIMVLGSLQLARAQKMTEFYIPIGQSPRVSGSQSIIGTIETINAPERRLTMTDAQGRYTVQVTERTQIWLDHSALKIRNQYGSFASLKPQLRVEVKYEESARSDQITAEWIKVEIREGRQ